MPIEIIVNNEQAHGQYAYIDTYTAGTKIATVLKSSDGTSGWDSAIGASIVSALDATTEYVIEPRVVFSGGGVSAQHKRLLEQKLQMVKLVK